MANGLSQIIAEAKRRRVFGTAGVYLVAVWGISQGAVELAPLFGAPDWALRWGLVGSLAFLPFVVILAWMFDIGRSGIVRDPQDLLAEQAEEAALADMPTILGGEEAVGAVIVRWQDASGERRCSFRTSSSWGEAMIAACASTICWSRESTLEFITKTAVG